MSETYIKSESPIPQWEGLIPHVSEDRLRDEFAMAALTGLLCHCPLNTYDENAVEAFNYADAMLSERRKRQKEGQ